MANKRPHMDDEGLERQREALREALRLCNRQIAERGDASPALNPHQASPAPLPAIAPTPPVSAPAATVVAATPLNAQPPTAVQPAAAAVSTYPASTANQAPVTTASSAPTPHRAATPCFESPDTASALANIVDNRSAPAPASRASFAQLVTPQFQEHQPCPETPPRV